MRLRFTKMHGLGNDYIYFEGVKTELPNIDWARLSIKLSDRHTGIGGDGIVLILPSEEADIQMRIFNADGSEAEMCGNASRCIGKFVWERKITDKKVVRMETKAGIKVLHLTCEDEEVKQVSVEMGKGKWEEIALHKFKDIKELENLDWAYEKIVYVNVGNPHAVIVVKGEISDEMVHGIGPKIEKHPYFEKGTNVEFIRIEDRENIHMRVWERGSGETMACGTGACASQVAAKALGLTEGKAQVHLLGGDLEIAIDKEGDITMTGGAEIAFDGEVEVEDGFLVRE